MTAARERTQTNKLIMYKKPSKRVTSNFSEVKKARRLWNEVFKMLKEKTISQELYI